MKVKELIELLNKLDQETEITVTSYCCRRGYNIEGIVEHKEFNKRTNKEETNYIISDCILEDTL